MEDFIRSFLGKYYPEGLSELRINDIREFFSEKLYNEYNTWFMNKEVVIQNKINSFDNLALPNAKVTEEYYKLIKIEDSDIEEYWVEGLEGAGLIISLEDNSIESVETDSIIETEQESVTVVEEIVEEQPTEETILVEGSTEHFTEEVKEEQFVKDVLAEQSNEAQVEEIIEESEKDKEKNIVIGTSERGIVIKGKPTVPGDFDVVVKFKYKGWFDGCKILERTIKFSVNPDPRSLWKNIETPKNIPFYKEDFCTEYITVYENEKGAQKDVVAASQRGRSHAHEGKPRDDDFRMFYNEQNGWYIMAVADGAGSAKYSRKGSEIACETCVEFCKNELNTPEELEKAIIELKELEEGQSNRTISTLIYKIVGGAAYKAHREIIDAAKTNKDQIRDYSTTLLLAICKKFDFGWFVASFWVGDGAMCIYNKDTQYIRVLGAPDGGEFAGQTRFLTMPEIFTPESIMSRLKYSIEEDFTALMLMTDGISDPFFETDANLNKIEKWNELWDNVNSKVDLTDDNSESQYQLLKWLDFWSPGNHDDRTIAILY